MTQPIDSIHSLKVMSKIIDAVCYNHARLALLRISNPLRIEIPDHRCLEAILSDDYWLCVDSCQEDQPILAWCDFDKHDHNAALHQPIPCQLRLYHSHAGLIMGSALDSLDRALTEVLSQKT
ncbi:MAG: hypothetical protein COB30_011705 [Ectothiorhodospiraceae bacterium]|nr:hypothetical protein [Ectothiorhodospiraceae bacterium]